MFLLKYGEVVYELVFWYLYDRVDEDGKISPWLILNSNNGKEMLKKLTDEQLAILNPILDIPYWLNKFSKLPADVELVKEVIKESQI